MIPGTEFGFEAFYPLIEDIREYFSIFCRWQLIVGCHCTEIKQVDLVSVYFELRTVAIVIEFLASQYP